MPGFQKPLPDEIEVSILGGGNGYGECIVVHAGFDHWIVVDSAEDPSTKKPLALSYFEEIGVNPATQVRLVIASHWHDDHVKGLANVLSQCKEAQFACSQALSPKEFLILLGLKERIASSNSGIKEFSAVFHHLKSAGKKIIRGIQDRVLWKTALPESTPLEVISLSPSDEALRFFEGQLQQLLDDSSPSKVIREVSPNHTSVVTVIKIGEADICLGGDLENTNDPAMGWQAVLKAGLVPNQTVSVFKVPHHGSENAYCPEFWEAAMTPCPIAGLTPYARGRKKLPAPSDIDHVYRHTDQAYITAPLERGMEKKRDPRAQKMIKSLGYDVREIPFSFGQICLRKPISQTELSWNVTLRGKALELKNLTLTAPAPH